MIFWYFALFESWESRVRETEHRERNHFTRHKTRALVCLSRYVILVMHTEYSDTQPLSTPHTSQAPPFLNLDAFTASTLYLDDVGQIAWVDSNTAV